MKPSPFIQMQICLLIKRKIGKLRAKLTVLWYDKKPTSLQSNGMAAIPKNISVSVKNVMVLAKQNVNVKDKFVDFEKVKACSVKYFNSTQLKI